MDDNDKRVESTKATDKKGFDAVGQCLLVGTVLISVISFSAASHQHDRVTMYDIWYYGWVTAVFTALGIIPFFFVSTPNKYWMGVSNAIAGGMMAASSYSLIMEGLAANEVPGFYGYHPGFRTYLGAIVGVIFLIITKKFLDAYEDVKVDIFGGTNNQRIFLIMFVMTLHSVSEGIGIGVSFGGARGGHLGRFISLSLAVHNIPEGLAVALVLNSRGVSKLRTALWCIFTSIPQPIMAVPAFFFIEQFKPLLPVGLGFAAGAMLFVALFELLAEAIEETGSWAITMVVAVLSSLLMIYLQDFVKYSLEADGGGCGKEF